jgi:hypothetical protein
MTKKQKCLRKLKRLLLCLLILAIVIGGFAWYKFFRVVPQPEFADAEAEFKYRSLGAENELGIPFWVWLVLPKNFPELMPGPGGYGAFGFPWEQGEEVPVGMRRNSIRTPPTTPTPIWCVRFASG